MGHFLSFAPHPGSKISCQKSHIYDNIFSEKEKTIPCRLGFCQSTVKEITELADINRATFYAHYDNIEALTREIETEMAQQVISAMDKLYQKSNYETDVIGALFDALVQRKEMCMWMLDDKVTGYGKRMIYYYARKVCVPRWKAEKNLTDAQAEWFLAYLYNGAMGFIKSWYEEGFNGDAEDRKHQFEEIVRSTLYYVYGRK